MRTPTVAFVVLLSLGAAACGSQDICHEIANIYQSQANQLTACGQPSPLGDGGASTPQETEACESEIQKCSASDQAAISVYLNCLAGLPGIECQWFTESSYDPSLSTYENDYQACEAKAPTVSHGCPFSSYGSSTGGGNGTWAGTYNVQSSSEVDVAQGSPEVLTGIETVTQSGSTVTIQSFAAPVLTACNLTLTVGSGSGATSASLDSPETCGNYTVETATANLSMQGSMSSIDVTGSLIEGSYAIDSVQVYLLSQ